MHTLTDYSKFDTNCKGKIRFFCMFYTYAERTCFNKKAPLLREQGSGTLSDFSRPELFQHGYEGASNEEGDEKIADGVDAVVWYAA